MNAPMNAAPNHAEAADPLDELTLLTTIIGEARGHVEEGRIVELHGLDARIGHLCDQLIAEAPDKRRGALPKLAALIGDLDALTKALTVQKKTLTEMTATPPENAARAYAASTRLSEQGGA